LTPTKTNCASKQTRTRKVLLGSPVKGKKENPGSDKESTEKDGQEIETH